MNSTANRLRFAFFLLIIFSLLASLAPVSDFDGDGFLDSFITDSLLLIPSLISVFGLIFLLTQLPVAYLTASRLFSTLLVPPPNIF